MGHFTNSMLVLLNGQTGNDTVDAIHGLRYGFRNLSADALEELSRFLLRARGYCSPTDTHTHREEAMVMVSEELYVRAHLQSVKRA